MKRKEPPQGGRTLTTAVPPLLFGPTVLLMLVFHRQVWILVPVPRGKHKRIVSEAAPAEAFFCLPAGRVCYGIAPDGTVMELY